MGRREFVFLISMLMALTALAIDMMLPAFAGMRASFGLEEGSSAVAPVVTAFLLGLGLGQPLAGPLSDATGRRPVLRVGIAVYVIGALGGMAAGSLTVLLAWRFVGGLGAGAVRVIATSVVRDRFRGEQMARVLSYVMAVFILVPVIAPSLGAAVLATGTWQAIFGVFVIGALATGAWATRLPESLPVERRLALRAGRLAAAAGAVLRSRFAMGLTIAQTTSFAFFASYLATSELLVGDVFGLGTWFPVIFGATALVLGAGMLLNPRALDRFGLRRWLRVVETGYLAAMLLLATIAVATAGHPPFWLFMVGLVPILLAQGFVMPNLNSAAMMPMGHVAGTAAAIIGAIVTLAGAAIGAMVDRAYDGSILPLASCGAVIALVGFVAYRWADAAWERSADRELAVGPLAGSPPGA